MNLTEAEHQQLEELLWNNSTPKFKAEFEVFKAKYASSLTLKEMFPVSSEFKPTDDGEVHSEDKRLLNEVIQ